MTVPAGDGRRKGALPNSAHRARHRAREPRLRRKIVAVGTAAILGLAGVATAAVWLTAPAERTLTVHVVRDAPSPSSSSATEPGSQPASQPATDPAAQQAPIPVSVLSDSHAFFAESWWRQTVEANAIDGVSMGAFASQPGAVAATIASGLDEAAAAAQNGYVLVQAGTNDLRAGRSAEDAAVDIQELWLGVQQRGSTPIAVLVPPSEQAGAEVVELNRLLAGAAREAGIAIVDVYSSVAEADGTWRPGTSDDGTHANLEGSTLQADAVLAQLPGILEGRLGQLYDIPSTDEPS